MYQAKAHGAGTLASFDRSMHDRLTPSTAEKRLREAVEREEFSLWYQPIVSLRTRRIIGAEALLRWDHPELGAIRPDDFMPALEDSGLIVPVGRWVIAEACAQSRAWSEALPGGRPFQVTVNLSARQIKQADFVDHLRDIVRSTNANPESIFLEIDDQALSADRGLVWQALRGAKRLGFRLALDDFGAGLTSLRHLHEFELDMLKIDPTYVAGLGVDSRGTAIVQHVIGLAKALSVITLAEAVETDRPSRSPAHVGLRSCARVPFQRGATSGGDHSDADSARRGRRGTAGYADATRERGGVAPRSRLTGSLRHDLYEAAHPVLVVAGQMTRVLESIRSE